MFDIENSLGFLLAKCHQKAFSICKARLEPYNITPPQFAALSFLWENAGINQIQLGELMEADKTTISGILDRLEKMELIERRPNPQDRRSSILFVTEKGKNLQEKLTSLAMAPSPLVESLTEEELEFLLRILKKIKTEGGQKPMNCAKCKDLIPEGEQYNHDGQVLCEDCYLDAIEPPRTCDVAAVHSAKKTRALAGQTGVEGLTDLQKDIYNFIKEQGKVTKSELLEKFQLSERELEKQFAVLRHCELLKGRKEGNIIYLIPFEA